MTPRSPRPNVVDQLLADAKAVCQRLQGFRRGADKPDLLIVQLCRGALGPSRNTQVQDVGAMPVVLLRRDPFQVFKAVVGLDSVLVIDLREPFGVRDEGQRQQAVDGDAGAMLSLLNVNAWVAVAVQAWNNDVFRPQALDDRSAPIVLAPFFKTVKGSVFVNLIKALVAGNGFAHYMIGAPSRVYTSGAL